MQALRYGLIAAAFNFFAVAAQAEPLRILAFGDSLTAGYGLAPEEAFPARLEARLKEAGIDAKVTNGGVSGDTTAGGLARLDWALAEKPQIVLLELGANDALRGIEPKVARANLDAMLAKIRAAGAKAILMGMVAPGNWGREYQQDFAALYPDLARKYAVPLYPFFLEGVAMDTSLNLGDGLHPNATGADLIAGHVVPLVKEVAAAVLAGG
jgi:acyl-CoA thioesterase-1